MLMMLPLFYFVLSLCFSICSSTNHPTIEMRTVEITEQDLATELTEQLEPITNLQTTIDKFDIQFDRIISQELPKIYPKTNPFVLHPKTASGGGTTAASSTGEYEILLPPTKTPEDYIKAINEQDFRMFPRPINLKEIENKLVKLFKKPSSQTLKHTYEQKELSNPLSLARFNEILFKNFALDSAGHLVVQANDSVSVPTKCNETIASILFDPSVKSKFAIFLPNGIDADEFIAKCASSLTFTTTTTNAEATLMFVKSILAGLSTQEAGGKLSLWLVVQKKVLTYSYNSANQKLEKTSSTSNLDFSATLNEELDFTKVFDWKKINTDGHVSFELIYLDYFQSIVNEQEPAFKTKTFPSLLAALKELVDASQNRLLVMSDYKTDTTNAIFFTKKSVTLEELKKYCNFLITAKSVTINVTDFPLNAFDSSPFKKDSGIIKCSSFPVVKGDSRESNRLIEDYVSFIMKLKDSDGKNVIDFNETGTAITSKCVEEFAKKENLEKYGEILKNISGTGTTTGDIKQNNFDTASGRGNKGPMNDANNDAKDGGGGAVVFVVIIVIIGIGGVIFYFAYVVPKRKQNNRRF